MAETDLTPEELGADTRLPLYNIDAYSPTTNQYGFDEDGHRVNQMRQANDAGIMGRLARRMALFARAQALLTAADRALTAEDAGNTYQDRLATAQSVLDAAGHVSKAAQWAGAAENVEVEPGKFSARHYALKALAALSGVSLPAISAAQALQFLRVKPDGTGYETAAVDLFSASLVFRSARTANAQIVKADKGKLIDITAGTFAQTFAAASTLGDGWWGYIRNAGTGDITLDPNGSETIDGLMSFIMYPGEVRLIQCDGTALRSVIIQAFTKSFLTSSTFVKPPGYRAFGGMLWSGGASGTRGNELGGAGGGAFPFQLSAAKVAASETVTIGAGGTPSTAIIGNPGGNSTFAGMNVIGAAGNGVTGAVAVPYTAGPNRRNQNDGFGGGSGNNGAIYGGAQGAASSTTAGTIFGGGGGGGVNSSGTIFVPTPTIFGGAGGAASSTGNGADGQQPGGGGGATNTGTQSGAGGAGQLDIWGII